MFKRPSPFTPATQQRQRRQRGRSPFNPRCLVVVALLSGCGWLMARPVLAASPAPGTVIQNQATGSFVDGSDGSTQPIESNLVQVTVAEVAGITVTATGNSGSFAPGRTVYFSYTITNVGNDSTQFLMPASANLTGNASQASNIEITGYSIDGSSLTTLATPIIVPNGGGQTGRTASGTLGLLQSPNANGEFQFGGYVTVRVPVLINSNANVGDIVIVMLGDTPVDPSSSATPQARLQNQAYIAGSNDLYTLDNPDILGVANEASGVPINGDTVNHRQEASAIQSITVVQSLLSVSGKIWNDADADLTINSSEAVTNAGSNTLTVYAINTTTSKIIDKTAVNATDGSYQLSGIPANLVGLKLRLSNDATLQVGDDAPLSPSIPTGWFFTGENLNGTIDPVIATLGDIALSTTTLNLTNENFGIRQSHTIAPDPAPTTCAPDFRTTINTGIDANGNALIVGSNDLNWTAEWITGPATGLYTPYATPRPVGAMPAVVTGKLAGTWINELPNAKWISYPFRLSPNTNGDHRDANLNGTSNQQTDTVRVKYTATVTLPSNANTISISVPVGVSVDNQFVSAKVNGIENITTPTQDAYTQGFTSLQSFNLSQGWQAGVNTIEIVTDSGPDLTGFFLSVNAETTQVCNSPNVLLVKRITGVNGSSNNGGIFLDTYDPETNTSNPSYAYDKNIIQAGLTPPSSDKWPNTTGATSSTFLLGARNGGTTKTGDEIEYTIYFLSTGIGSAKNVTICDRIPRYQAFVPDAFNSLTVAPNTTPTSPGGDRGIAVFQGSTTNADTVYGYTNIGDGDAARYYPPGSPLPSACTQPALAEDNGTIVVNLGDIPNATTPGTPKESYGFLRFRAKVK